MPHSVPPTLQEATAKPHLCQRLLDTPGHVWVGLLNGHCSFLLGSGACKLLFVPSKSLFPQSCVISDGSMAELMVTSSKRAYAIPRFNAPRAPAPACPIPDLYLFRRHSKTVLSQPLQGPWVLVCTRYVWVIWESLVGMRFDSKHDLTPSTVLLGLLLCPWMGGYLLKVTPALHSSWSRVYHLACWGFSALGCGVSPHSHSSAAQPPIQVCIVKAKVFPVVIYRWESWIIKTTEHQRIDAFKLWCWRRLLRVL